MTDILISDHRELDRMLAQLLSSFDNGTGLKAFGQLDRFWAHLAMHIRAEHLHLFPSIIAGAKAKTRKDPSSESAQNAIDHLHRDHDFFMHELADCIKLMREIDHGNYQDRSTDLSTVHEKIKAVEVRLKEHNILEETKVYRWAETFLDTRERIVLNDKMQKELDNLPPRFL